MAALAADRTTPQRAGTELELPVAAATKIYAGAIVAMNASGGAAGYATKGATATVLRGVGVAVEQADNSAGAAGDIRVKVRRGTWRFLNSASGDQITQADIGNDCYIVDDQTVAKTNGTNTRSVAGKVQDVDAGGVWVTF
jgi:hypothetical protein